MSTLRFASSVARRCVQQASRRSTVAATAWRPAATALPWSQLSSVRSFADDGSHSDFAPQKKELKNDDTDEAVKMIDQHVKEHDVMLYMKGSPSMPMCGFSARVVQVLKDTGVDFSSVNVLDYPSIREGVKKYSDWPTIPQLYVKGEFIGGCDVVEDMHQSGELQELVKDFVEEKSS